ncbi:A/G-specific adenine glycosylase [Rubellicoccus peritrichatus]|uniref:Adenine DNA glycosylase n=1 Tax=Rubellicoccus peritrichatus TaxID=3080537 RepID=A0AAQ3QPX4_9BACT|nr:A/G-specific adenine glycosylase [Puniceicoccus sp. CR14]WOO39578.1 A/G-specific adenine glycosylase [Puniceicoccus sp. CR14]
MKTEKRQISEIPFKNPEAFSAELSAWFSDAARDLPWRSEPSLYRTVVSEFMLQQTQVTTMLPYFDRWMQNLPDFEALANASEETVVKLWEGLGYYTRARNLRKLAIQWVAAPIKPEGAAEWLNYPGVGPYTAAAIASIAQKDYAAVVDGNVVRILARLTNDTRDFPDSTSAVKAFTSTANQLIQTAESPGTHNEAMMELGATLCVRAKPQCLLCPVRDHCEGYKNGDPETLPKITRRKIVRKSIDRLFCVSEGQILLYKRPKDSRRLAGQFELPDFAQLGIKAASGDFIAKKSRGIANERIEESIYQVQLSTDDLKQTSNVPDHHWIKIDDLDKVTMTGPHRKWLSQLLAKQKPGA